MRKEKGAALWIRGSGWEGAWNAGASAPSATLYLIPIHGVFWGAVILNEQITWQTPIALVLILAGVALVNEVGRKRSALTDMKP